MHRNSEMAQHFAASLGYGVIGNTTDSGPVILGSSPGIPTETNLPSPAWKVCLLTNFPINPFVFSKKSKKKDFAFSNGLKDVSLHKFVRI